MKEIERILFRWYYKRVPEHFRQYRFKKSVKLLIEHHKHHDFVDKANNEIIANAIKVEKEMRQQITNLQLQVMSVPDDMINVANKMFDTNLGNSTTN